MWGYASGPILKAAQAAGIPTLLQEQNSYAGVTNKILASKATDICVAYSGMERFFPAGKIVMTGNPVRSSLLELGHTQEDAKKALGFDPSRPLVIVVGGSLGARTVNQAIEASVDDILDAGASVLWQTGKLYNDEYIHIAEGRGHLQIQPFVSAMDIAYKAADLVVSRAGAKYYFRDTASWEGFCVGAFSECGRRPSAQECHGVGCKGCCHYGAGFRRTRKNLARLLLICFMTGRHVCASSAMWRKWRFLVPMKRL